MPPPMDLGARFSQLVTMISNDMKDVGGKIQQIVAKVTQQDQRIAALEARLGKAGMAPGTPQTVAGQVVSAHPAATPEVPDATPLWNGSPNAFYQGGEND